MKSLCLSTFVFGEEYQCFIPLLIYSIKRAYPDYVPIVYVYSELNGEVKAVLSEVKNELGDFVVLPNHCPHLRFSDPQKGKSIRWLLSDPMIRTFSAAYFIDIDIFYVRETPTLFEQHECHCETLSLPYSNIVRDTPLIDAFDFRSAKRIVGGYGVSKYFRLLRAGKIKPRRMSGLHFVITKPYFEKIGPLLDKYTAIVASNDSFFCHHLDGFNNECLLYDLILESGLGVPPAAKSTPEVFDYRNFDKAGFRPHHGIHLGIFRSQKSAELNRALLTTEYYLAYYREFKRLYECDALLRYIVVKSPGAMQNLITQMSDFYESYQQT